MDNFLMPERHRARRFLPYVLLLMGLSACTTVGPDYVEPKQPLPVAWLHEQTGFARQDPDSLRRWWPVLQRDHPRYVQDAGRDRAQPACS